jgi:hypothetical protein
MSLKFLASTPDLQSHLIEILELSRIAFVVDERNAVSVLEPLWGDVHDLVIERLYDPVFGNWCVLSFDDDCDAAELRRELITKDIPFVEEFCESGAGIVLSSANAPD